MDALKTGALLSGAMALWVIAFVLVDILKVLELLHAPL